MAAMIAIFGWRRMTYGRRFIVRVGTGSPGIDPQKAMEYFGEKPKLWDLETQQPVENEDGLTWQGMMPLSATFKKSQAETLSPPDNTSAQVVGTTARPRVPPQLENFGRQFRRPIRARNSTDSSQPEPVESPSLQVAMAIAMPSSRIHEREWMHEESLKDISNHTHEPFIGDDRMEYSLGLMDIPWHSAET
jgi:hypothetical protein